MFRAINIKEKLTEERVVASYVNDKVMLDSQSCLKTLKLVKKTNKSGIFKAIENLKLSLN